MTPHRTTYAEPSVNDIPDNELLGRVVRSFRPSRRAGAGKPRWVAVAEVTGLGSTYAAQLCRRFGMDPHELVRNQP